MEVVEDFNFDKIRDIHTIIDEEKLTRTWDIKPLENIVSQPLKSKCFILHKTYITFYQQPCRVCWNTCFLDFANHMQSVYLVF